MDAEGYVATVEGLGIDQLHVFLDAELARSWGALRATAWGLEEAEVTVSPVEDLEAHRATWGDEVKVF